jgi:predicted Zn-dependent protease
VFLDTRGPSRVAVAAAIAGICLLAGSASAHQQAKTWGDQYYDPQPCLDTVDDPCIEWPKTANNLSVTVDVYMSYLLSQEEVDFKPIVGNSMSKWNQIAARNPYLQETTSTSNEEVWVTTDLLNHGVYAQTTYGPFVGAEYHIQSAVVEFNQRTIFNTSYNYYYDPVDNIPTNADARKVATHELGHVEGMGHVGHNEPYVAVMKQGDVNQWWPAVDDVNGIIAIYGAYP